MNIEGTCMLMCPLEEITMREKENLLHRLEMVRGTEYGRNPKADRNKVVKCFSRSAAGKNMQSADVLRPSEILIKTVGYLLKKVFMSKEFKEYVIYDFIMDRLRAVRQDMVIQGVPISFGVAILQPIVHFYAFSSYNLCEAPSSKYDPLLNCKHLQECTKRLLIFYDECDMFKENYEDYVEKYGKESFHAYRLSVESIYLLNNLGNVEAMTRGINLLKKWRIKDIQTSFTISIGFLLNNWIRVCKLIKTLPPLLAAVVSQHLPQIRRKAFQAMSVAFNSKQLRYPLDVLKEELLYDSIENLKDDINYYGISCRTHEENVQFTKDSFEANKKPLPPRKEQFIEEQLKSLNISSLLYINE